MKLRVHFEISDRSIDETVTGETAEAILAEAKNRVAKELGWKGVFLHALTTLQFAQLAVKMYNDHHGTDHRSPQTADDFVEFGLKTGNVDVMEE